MFFKDKVRVRVYELVIFTRIHIFFPPFFEVEDGHWKDRILKHKSCPNNSQIVTHFVFVKTENSKRPVAFESRQQMGEELDSLRATIDDQHIYDNNSSSAHPKSPRRRKRFLSYPRYVELMVTADVKMVRHHGRNLEHYILTIMSVVSKIMFLKIITLSQL